MSHCNQAVVMLLLLSRLDVVLSGQYVGERRRAEDHKHDRSGGSNKKRVGMVYMHDSGTSTTKVVYGVFSRV